MYAFKRIVFWISFVIISVIMTFCIAFRLKNPELTETQLMIKLWWTMPTYLSFMAIILWSDNRLK